MFETLSSILETLPCTTVSNEKMYNLSQFETALEQDINELYKAEELIVTPFYVTGKRMYELYAFELKLMIVEEEEGRKLFIKSCGKSQMDEIPIEVMRRHENCTIELPLGSQSFPKTKLLAYINYLKTAEEVQKEIVSSVGSFDLNNLYFEIY